MQNLIVYADAAPKKIDVWDFGGVTMSDTSLYNNNIIRATWDGISAISATGAFTAGDLSIGDLTIKANSGDRLYCPGGAKNYTSASGYSLSTYKDSSNNVEYTANGMYYIGGTGTDTTKLMKINVTKGDKVIFYMGANNALPGSLHFSYPDTGTVASGTYTQNDSLPFQAATKCEFIAQYTGIYKVWYNGTAKAFYNRIVRIPGVSVSGAIDLSGTNISGYSLKFMNNVQGRAEILATVNPDNTYSAVLAAGETYTAVLTDATGYGITGDTNLVSTTLSDVANGKSGVNLIVESQATYNFTGSLVGFDSNYDLSKLAIKLVPPAGSHKLDVNMTITGSTFSAVLRPDVDYTVNISGVNDYSCSFSSLNKSADYTQDITFTKKPTYGVTLTMNGLDEPTAASSIVTFASLTDVGYSYTYTGTSGGALRDGTYAVSVVANSQNVQKLTSNLVVSGASASKTINFAKAYAWDFSNPAFATSVSTFGSYNGLTLTGVTQAQNKYAYIANTGSINVPVDGNSKVTIYYCYAADGKVGGMFPFSTTSHSYSQIDSVSYYYYGNAGIVPIALSGETNITKIEVTNIIPYKDTITVGSSGCDYTTINQAVTAIKSMNRNDATPGQPPIKRVTVSIQPGNYEEMVLIDEPYVTLKNASTTPSIALKDAGVGIADQAVRITSYYGVGYNYYSQRAVDCQYDAEVLAVNKENNSASSTNPPGGGTTNNSYWNATVRVSGQGFVADGIIFENSYNQYVSEKEANDTLVIAGIKPTRPTTVGSTDVQNKTYVERAAALAIYNNIAGVEFTNCRFVGRQDTLYGGTGTTVAFNKCNIMGGTDYIMGGMSAVFYKCDLTFNTSDASTDVGYITAPQQKIVAPQVTAPRGYLMYGCNITSTTPGLDTASTLKSKPGYFGRPWEPLISEVVFYGTTIGSTTTNVDGLGNVTTQATPQSLIVPAGWLSTLGGTSDKIYEFVSKEAAGVDNSTSRVSWSKVISTPYIDAGATAITISAFLGSNWTTQLQSNGKLLEDIKADYTALNSAIATAQAKNQLFYTSFAELTSVLYTATAIAPNQGLEKQATIDASTTALNNAINALVLKDADYTALTAAISSAAALIGTNYTSGYSAVSTALTAAQAVPAGLKITSQETIDTALANLNAAVAGLVLKDADYTALAASITSASAKIASNYVTGAQFTAALTAAQAVPAGLKITSQATIDTALANLNNAVAGLVLKDADYSALAAAITSADALIAANYLSGYPAVTSALTAAKAVGPGLKITSQGTLDTAVANLNAAVAGLVLKDADYTALTASITSASGLISANYSIGYSAVNTALTAAQAVPAGLKITSQGTINTASINLNNAVAGLVLKNADYTALATAITSASALISSNYLTGYSAVTTALSAAQAVPTGLKITSQATINTALVNLNAAVAALVLKDAVYTALNSAITAAQVLTASTYTDASYAVLTIALTNAKAVATGLKIDQQSTIDSAVTALNSAVAALLIKIVIPATGNTDIILNSSTNIVPTGSTFATNSVTSGAVYDNAVAVVKQKSTEVQQFVVLEMNLNSASGVAIHQLDGKVSVTIPVPTGLDATKSISVFRVETDGSLTKLDTKIVDGKCVFETDHFSTYVIAQVAEAAVVPPVVIPDVPTTPPTPPTTPTTPKTGDRSPITMYILIMGIAAGTVVYASKKRKFKRV